MQYVRVLQWTLAHAHTHTHTHTHIHTRTHIHTYVPLAEIESAHYMHRSTYASIFPCHTYIHTYMHTYIHNYINTYVHIHTFQADKQY